MGILKQLITENQTSTPEPTHPQPQEVTLKGVPIVFDPTLGADEVEVIPRESISDLLADLAARGISIVQVDGKLKYKPADAMTPQLRRRILAAMAAVGCPNQEPEPEPVVLEEIDPPPPCPRCGSLDLWESPDRISVSGFRWRCRRCDPPRRTEAWARKAARLRAEKELRSKRQH